ncbi:MAG: DUF1848 domain-containing protein [Limnochordia bacterium]|jgi:hypothetical protein|nr:DUF1848 domain-containing protein [Limnochordia bacterium]MDD2630105.1 DUF1848 domain-containing protein [Limnochordia bacterium]MDD4518385.1 DUF1848 domain-containing protein [Limnochordia bacterium]
MIISASRRTDIPGFYADWFMNRLNEGYFIQVNPYNQHQRPIEVSPDTVDAFVFWTKHPAPLLPHLVELDDLGYRYYFQYTLNSYPEFFEPLVPPLDQRIATFHKLSAAIGSDKVLWRYDPIILSSATPQTYHLEQFEQIAESLAGYTCRCTISFLDVYTKIKPKLRRIEQEQGITITQEPSLSTRQDLVAALNRIGFSKGISLVSCAEPADTLGIPPGCCISYGLINQLFGLRLNTKKDPNQRPLCQCDQSIDIGMYDTCGFGCTYCYANHRKNIPIHNPLDPLLKPLT